MRLSRRSLLLRAGAATGALIGTAAIRLRPADAAEFDYKCGTSLPASHPMCVRSREAMAKIKDESGGRLVITLHPDSALGPDTTMISQTIDGALECYFLAIDMLALRNPSCGVCGLGFAFRGYDHVWAAMDGALGHYLRGIAEQIGFHCLDTCFDHGFRQITSTSKPIKTPDDLKDFKIRLPVTLSLVSLFRHLGASPVPINFEQVYTALKTGVVDGQENPLIQIDAAKLYEVQRYCSMTNHAWTGIHMSFGVPYWKKLPRDLQELCEKHFSEAALAERSGWPGMTDAETGELAATGMVFDDPDIAAFRRALAKSGYYPAMKQQVGDKSWSLLEKYSGPLI